MQNSTFVVFDAVLRKWLDASERAWTRNFEDAAHFTASALAEDIARREAVPGSELYVMQATAIN